MTRTLTALLVSTLLLTACGDDDGGGGSTAAPERETATAEGTGYTLEVPEGFRDVKDRLDGSAIRIDLAYADPDASGFATNINVIRETPGGEFDLADVMEAVKPQVESQATDAGLGEIEDRELDGVAAKTYAYDLRNEQNGRVRQRQVVAVQEDAIYTITWSVAADDFEAQEPVFDQILSSWRWS